MCKLGFISVLLLSELYASSNAAVIPTTWCSSDLDCQLRGDSGAECLTETSHCNCSTLYTGVASVDGTTEAYLCASTLSTEDVYVDLYMNFTMCVAALGCSVENEVLNRTMASLVQSATSAMSVNTTSMCETEVDSAVVCGDVASARLVSVVAVGTDVLASAATQIDLTAEIVKGGQGLLIDATVVTATIEAGTPTRDIDTPLPATIVPTPLPLTVSTVTLSESSGCSWCWPVFAVVGGALFVGLVAVGVVNK